MKLGLIKAPSYQDGGHWEQGLQDDLELGQFAESVGFSEFLLRAPRAEDRSSLNPGTVLMTKLAERTDRMRLGVDAAIFGQASPDALAQAISLTDQLSDGRLVVITDSVPGDANALSEASNALGDVLSGWRATGANWPGSRTNAAGDDRWRPLQYPHPEILFSPSMGGKPGFEAAAAYGFSPISASWLSQPAVASHWPATVAGFTRSMRRVCPSIWRVARSIFICDNKDLEKEYTKGTNSPYRRHYETLFPRAAGSAAMDDLLSKTIITGSADQVIEKIATLRESVGGFGTLLCVTPIGGDRTLDRASLRRLAEQVLPALNFETTNSARKLERS